MIQEADSDAEDSSDNNNDVSQNNLSGYELEEKLAQAEKKLISTD